MQLDTTARPPWQWTGYRFFPYAAKQSGTWWVLRLNHGFPEHDLYTLFIDGNAVADLTGDPDSSSPLVAGISSLMPYGPQPAEPRLDADVAADVVRRVSGYVNYGSERDDPCEFCSADFDGMAHH